MSSLVYLISSLPSLSFGQVPPITMEEFNRDAQNQLSVKHFNQLESVDLYSSAGSERTPGLKSIGEMLSDLKKDISEIRTANTQKRAPGLDRLPKAIVNANPLEREKLIMKWQWEELDNIEAGETFTFTEVMVYKLRLQILNRLNSFDKERGKQILASVVNPSKEKEV